MTSTSPAILGPGTTRTPGGQTIAIELLVCGDDGAAIKACERLAAGLPADVRLRMVGQLDVDHLLSIAEGAGVVIVDAATGIDPGSVVELPLAGLIDEPAVRPRSSHSLAIPGVVGLAETIRGRPLRGRIVAIGAAEFGFGQSISEPVAMALPALSLAILDAIERARPGNGPGPRGA